MEEAAAMGLAAAVGAALGFGVARTPGLPHMTRTGMRGAEKVAALSASTGLRVSAAAAGVAGWVATASGRGLHRAATTVDHLAP